MAGTPTLHSRSVNGTVTGPYSPDRAADVRPQPAAQGIHTGGPSPSLELS